MKEHPYCADCRKYALRWLDIELNKIEQELLAKRGFYFKQVKDFKDEKTDVIISNAKWFDYSKNGNCIKIEDVEEVFAKHRGEVKK